MDDAGFGKEMGVMENENEEQVGAASTD